MSIESGTRTTCVMCFLVTSSRPKHIVMTSITTTTTMPMISKTQPPPEAGSKQDFVDRADFPHFFYLSAGTPPDHRASIWQDNVMNDFIYTAEPTAAGNQPRTGNAEAGDATSISSRFNATSMRRLRPAPSATTILRACPPRGISATA